MGGVVGPVVSGVVLQHFGFARTFLGFAALAFVAAVLFQGLVKAEPANDLDTAEDKR